MTTIALTGSLVMASAQDTTIERTTANVPLITLNDGNRMPQFGLGTYMIADGDDAYGAVMTALKNGYRKIDTAHAYGNERSVGRAVRESGINRKDIWVTSKLWPNEYGEGKTMKAIDRMLARFGFDYIDLVYLHQPVGDYRGAWRELEEAVRIGKVRSIGISNFDFNDEMFSAIVDSMTITPAAMQIECHPYAQRLHWQEKLKTNGILLESWFPLGGRESGGVLLRDSVINDIARTHGKTAAQIIIRWHVQKGFSVIPGTDNPDYIKENISVFDFVLTPDEMQKIDALNREHRFFTMPYEQVRDRFGKYEIWD